MLQCVIKQNTHSSMDRIHLESWLIGHGIEYRLGRFGDWLCWLSTEQIEALQNEGWPVRVL